MDDGPRRRYRRPTRQQPALEVSFMFEVRISPPRVSTVLLVGFGILLALHIAVIILRIEYARDYVYGLAPKFDFDRPISIPDWYTGLLFLLAATLSLLAGASAARFERRQRPYWRGLGILLLYLSFDEVASIHAEVASLLSPAGAPVFARWVPLYATATVAIGLWLVPFLRSLPRSTAIALLASGILFVGGALGLEFAGGELAEQITSTPLAAVTHDQWVEVRKHWSYVAMATTEETCEMSALILYIAGVAGYLSRRGASFGISFA